MFNNLIKNQTNSYPMGLAIVFWTTLHKAIQADKRNELAEVYFYVS